MAKVKFSDSLPLTAALLEAVNLSDLEFNSLNLTRVTLFATANPGAAIVNDPFPLFFTPR